MVCIIFDIYFFFDNLLDQLMFFFIVKCYTSLKFELEPVAAMTQVHF